MINLVYSLDEIWHTYNVRRVGYTGLYLDLVLSSDARYKSALLCIMLSKLRNLCDIH